MRPRRNATCRRCGIATYTTIPESWGFDKNILCGVCKAELTAADYAQRAIVWSEKAKKLRASRARRLAKKTAP